MLRTINGDFMSPFTILLYCASALGEKLSNLMDSRFREMSDSTEKMEFVYIGERADDLTGETVLVFTVTYHETLLKYLFNTFFECIEVCVMTEDEEAVAEHERFFNEILQPEGESGHKWSCQNKHINGMLSIECFPDETGGYSIQYRRIDKPKKKAK